MAAPSGLLSSTQSSQFGRLLHTFNIFIGRFFHIFKIIHVLLHRPRIYFKFQKQFDTENEAVYQKKLDTSKAPAGKSFPPICVVPMTQEV